MAVGGRTVALFVLILLSITATVSAANDALFASYRFDDILKDVQVVDGSGQSVASVTRVIVPTYLPELKFTYGTKIEKNARKRTDVDLYVVRNDRFVYVIRVFQLPKHRDVVLDTIIAEKAFARLSEVKDFNLFSHVSSGLWVQVSPAYQEYSDERIVVKVRPWIVGTSLGSAMAFYMNSHLVFETLSKYTKHFAIGLAELHLKTRNEQIETSQQLQSSINNAAPFGIRKRWPWDRVWRVLQVVQRSQAVVFDQEKLMMHYNALRSNNGQQRLGSVILGKPDVFNGIVNLDNGDQVAWNGIWHSVQYMDLYGVSQSFGPPELDYHVARFSIELTSKSLHFHPVDTSDLLNLFDNWYCGVYHVNLKGAAAKNLSSEELCSFPDKDFEDYVKFVAAIVILQEEPHHIAELKQSILAEYIITDWVNADDEGYDYSSIKVERI